MAGLCVIKSEPAIISSNFLCNSFPPLIIFWPLFPHTFTQESKFFKACSHSLSMMQALYYSFFLRNFNLQRLWVPVFCNLFVLPVSAGKCPASLVVCRQIKLARLVFDQEYFPNSPFFMTTIWASTLTLSLPPDHKLDWILVNKYGNRRNVTIEIVRRTRQKNP